MTFQFDSEIAKLYGVNEAIFINNIYFWINHNVANNKHFYDGRFWTYNTKKAFTELFPFWTYEQVKNIIKKLIEKEVLITGNFNENTWDKTAWYSLSENIIEMFKNGSKVNEIALLKFQQSNVEKSIIECGKINNRMGKFQLSYIGTDNKTDNKTQIEGALAFFENNFPSSFKQLMMQYKSQITDFVKFAEMFEATVEQEGLAYEQNVLSGRFKKFARNWIDNQKRFDKHVSDINTNVKKEKIGGFC